MVLASHRRGGHNSDNVLEIDLIRKLFIKGRTTRLVKTLRGPKRAGERQPKSVLPASAGPACWASCFPHRLGLDRQGFAASRSQIESPAVAWSVVMRRAVGWLAGVVCFDPTYCACQPPEYQSTASPEESACFNIPSYSRIGSGHVEWADPVAAAVIRSECGYPSRRAPAALRLHIILSPSLLACCGTFDRFVDTIWCLSTAALAPVSPASCGRVSQRPASRVPPARLHGTDNLLGALALSPTPARLYW